MIEQSDSSNLSLAGSRCGQSAGLAIVCLPLMAVAGPSSWVVALAVALDLGLATDKFCSCLPTRPPLRQSQSRLGRDRPCEALSSTDGEACVPLSLSPDNKGVPSQVTDLKGICCNPGK